MPAHPLPLRAKEPAKRPKGIPDGLWYFPRNLSDHANAAGFSPKQVATLAGVSAPTVSRWLSYDEDSLGALSLLVVLRLEEAMGLQQGTLQAPPAPFVARRGA